MPKKTANITENNWLRIEVLLKNGCYDNMKEAINDLIRRGLPLVEDDIGIKKRRV